MKFTYPNNHSSTDIKSLLTEVFQETGLIPNCDLIFCNGIRWDDPKSDFAKDLDVSLSKYRLQLDFILNNFKSQKKDSELAIARLQKNTKPSVLKTMLKGILAEEPIQEVTEIVKEQKALKVERDKIKKKLS